MYYSLISILAYIQHFNMDTRSYHASFFIYLYYTFPIE